jgi:hypothetical protein
MSELALFNKMNRPAFASGALSATALALAGGGNNSKRISIKGGVFRLISSGKEVARIDDRFMDVVVVAAAPRVSRTFYGAAFDESVATPPACWSADGDKPDASVANKPASSCATCPNNVKGSGTGESRACRYSQRIAVVLANDVAGDVLQLTLPATSIFGKAEGDNRPLQEYARFMAAQGNDVGQVVTRMRFDTDAAVPKMFFKPMRWLTEDEYADATAAAASPEAQQAIAFTVSQQDGVAKPVLPSPTPSTPPPVPTKAKVVAPVEEEEPPAPAPKAARKAAAPVEDAPVKRVTAAATPAPTKAIADVLAEWDDE